jgi:YHS domain-containing protein
MSLTSLFVRAAASVAVVAFAAAPGLAASPVNASYFGKLAIHGYDPVAYFNAGKPVPGDKRFTADWNGATWRFASAENRELFRQDPGKYAPQYGGFCAWAVSKGSTADIDPAAWKIVDGKLYLNYSPDVQKQWEADMKGAIERADANWPKLSK